MEDYTIVISTKEYKELVRAQVTLEVMRNEVEKNKYFNREDAARHLHVEIKEDEN